MTIATGGSGARIDIDYSSFARIEVVDIEDRSYLQLPVHWFETSVSVKEIERGNEILLQTNFVTTAEEVWIVRIERALSARRRQANERPNRVADPGQLEKDVLADDRVVALEHVLIVRIPPMTLRVRVFARRTPRIAIPRWQVDTP